MILEFQPYDLHFKHTFAIANFSRTFTRIVLTQIKLNGYSGYGEASIPSYLGETADMTMAFLEKVKLLLKNISYPFDIEAIMCEIDALEINYSAAKAAVDIALHDVKAKIENQSVWTMLGANNKMMPITSLTLGMDTPSVLKLKVEEATDFKVLKIKLGSEDDKKIIQTIRELTDKPLYVDANQGWKDKHLALDMAHWLHEKGVQLIEQPMPKEDLEGNAFVTEGSPIPTFADESFQRLSDLPKIMGAFHGINIKLMKCTGLNEGLKIIHKARENKLKILMGCMSETSCGIMAGASMASFCDFVDLDGPWLIANNPFKTPKLLQGKIQLKPSKGLGLVKIEKIYYP
jgi:L-Ala-D/L-Glu epimerase